MRLLSTRRETQQTDYPRVRPDRFDREPRGGSRGASYRWYPYSAIA
jgi:nitrate reductase alpha subunit